MSKETTYKKDAVILFETGEYSDFYVCMVAKALIEFDAAAYVARFKKILPPEDPENPRYYGHQSEFLQWLVKESVVEEIPTENCHIGSYGRLEINE